ncbi:hypothetical protein JFV28_01180 [Pseudomonas sp. TH05]|uniref:hypothetical protein n=1 Tax=unclassified Pseudomonas TaxID=196821 RepID=UPI000996BE41|nr:MULTISPECIES: hypothetical protein [unclassified Pseudomonas]MBK5542557.1 hypothetical protein [Pseudomonas sp. TH07]MBK5554477.1 hypothetical protein [Pseudomonas sp. TH05]OOV89138.1 hypothetical protein MF4836_34325 [Pseudomonas sp. MF4836]
MNSVDDFRYRSHQLLMELDAATCDMMKLVSAHQLTGPEWEIANRRQHEAYKVWNLFLNEPPPRT